MAAGLLVGLLGAIAVLRHAWLRMPGSPSAIRLDPSGRAELRLSDGQVLPLVAHGGMGITRWWVAVRAGEGRGTSILLPAGMLPPAQHRLLRLWAIWGKLPG